MVVKTIEFNVAGVTFKNKEGKDIQKEIKRVLKEYKQNDYFDELYGGYTNKEIKEMDLNVSEYEGCQFQVKVQKTELDGEDCFEIHLKTYNNEYVHIGYMPKNRISEFTEWSSKEDLKVNGKLEIVGGKYRYCEIYEEDYEEKERVSTKELTYGAKITFDFCNNEISPQYKKMQEEKEKIIKEQKREKIISTLAVLAVCLPFFWLGYKILSFIIGIFD